MAFSLALDAPDGKASRVSSELAPARIEKVSRTLARPGDDKVSEQVWLRAVKAAGPQSDILQRYGARIFVTSSGRYYVPVAGERSEILEMQRSSALAARVLAGATRSFKAEIAASTGREPSRAALFLAHSYGTDVASAYVRALNATPEKPAGAVLASFAFDRPAQEKLSLEAFDARLSAMLGADTSAPAHDALRVRAPARRPLMADVIRSPIKGTLTRSDAPADNKLAAR